MSRRTQRVANLIRNTLGQVIPTGLSDPRINPALMSITRVEIAEDLMTANVFVSVVASPAAQRLTLRTLQHASGRLQELMMRKIRLRHTPALVFQIDEKYHKTMETLRIIQQATDEITQKQSSMQDDQNLQTDENDDSLREADYEENKEI